MSLNIELKEKKVAYWPGEAIEGEVCFDHDPAPPALVVRLSWRTDAQGSQSEPVSAVEQRIENPAAGHAHHPFSLKAPDAPWSFAGSLFSIRWFVRVEDGEGHSGEAEVVISPTGGALTAPAPQP